MAQGVTKDEIKKIDSKLECSICLDTFKQPKLLPCYHVFCKSPCLEKLVIKGSRSLTCPTCRHVVPLSERGVAGLQSDFHIDHLFEIRNALNKSAESAKTYCGNCEKETSTGYCQECQDFLCDKCQVNHKWLKLTRDHQIIGFQEFQKNVLKIIQAKKKIRTCGKHSGTELKIYCDTCKELICYYCTIRLHKGHNCDPVADVFSKHKKELESNLRPLKQKLNKVQQALMVFDNLVKEIHNHRATLEADIHKEIDDQHRLLDQRRTELIGELKMLTEHKLKVLATQRENIEMTRVKLISCLEYTEGAIKTGTQCQILEMKVPALKRIKHIQSTDFVLDSLYPKINFTTVVKKDKDILKEKGKSFLKLIEVDVCNGSVDSGIEKVTVNEKAKFELSVDTYQSLVDAKVTFLHSHTMLECQVIKRDNKCQITYKPNYKGRYEINLTISGKHIKGSPFTVVAMPQPQTLGMPSQVITNLKSPWGVAVNSKGHIIVADNGSGQIIIYNENYIYIRAFNSQSCTPAGVTVDDKDNIYVSDCEKHNVQKFTANGQFLLAVGTKGNQKLQFNTPCKLEYKKAIYVSDYLNNRIQVLNTDLTFHSMINVIGLKQPAGVSFDSIGNIYIANFGGNNVIVCDSNGKLMRTFGTHSDFPGLLNRPLGITVSNTDIVYVAELSGHRISIFTKDGKFIHSFGEQLHWPSGLAIDSKKSIVVTNRKNGHIQVF